MSLVGYTDMLLQWRVAFQERAGVSRRFLDYVQAHRIDLMNLGRFAGGYAVINVTDMGARRFDFADEAAFPAWVMEVFGVDGESVEDLIAWPLDRPEHIMTALGRAGLVGVWQAMAPQSFFMDAAPRIFRTPLRWMQENCDGCAIADPVVAAQQLVQTPGRLCAEDQRHGRELVTLLKTAFDPATKIIAPKVVQRSAA